MKRFLAVLMLVGGLLVAGGANAAMTIEINDSGANVVVSFNGSINTGALTSSTGAFSNILNSSLGFAMIGRSGASGISSSTNKFLVTFGINDGVWGTGATATPSTTVSGSEFGFWQNGEMLLPTAYVSGASISGSSTYTGTSLSALGFNAGTYNYSWGSGATADTLTVCVGPCSTPSAVPTLSEWAQLMLALMVIGIAWHFHNNRQNSY